MYNLLELQRLQFLPVQQAVRPAQQLLDRGVERHGKIEPRQAE